MAAVDEVVPAGSEIIPTANIRIFILIVSVVLIILFRPTILNYLTGLLNSIDFTTASIFPLRMRRYECTRTSIPFFGISVSGSGLRRQSRKRGS